METQFISKPEHRQEIALNVGPMNDTLAFVWEPMPKTKADSGAIIVSIYRQVGDNGLAIRQQEYYAGELQGVVTRHEGNPVIEFDPTLTTNTAAGLEGFKVNATKETDCAEQVITRQICRRVVEDYLNRHEKDHAPLLTADSQFKQLVANAINQWNNGIKFLREKVDGFDNSWQERRAIEIRNKMDNYLEDGIGIIQGRYSSDMRKSKQFICHIERAMDSIERAKYLVTCETGLGTDLGNKYQEAVDTLSIFKKFGHDKMAKKEFDETHPEIAEARDNGWLILPEKEIDE